MGFLRKHLSADGLMNVVRHSIKRERIKETPQSKYSWNDCIMSGLAVFGLKFPSLLQFEQNKESPLIRRNLRTLYGVEDAPSDTQMRERLDQLSPEQLRRPFKTIFACLHERDHSI
jgi:hypothetical protein